jgi:hypothetical protein
MRVVWLCALAGGCLFITDADRARRAELLAEADSGSPTAYAGDDDDDGPGPTGDDDDDLTTGTVPGSWTAASVGHDLSCAIDDRGQVACWSHGTDPVGEWWPELPVDLDAVGVSVGLGVGCVWSASGETRCFGPEGGTDNNPEPGVVERPGSYDEVSCGVRQCCGLTGGQLECWGAPDAVVEPNLGVDVTSGITSVSVWGPACTLSDGDVVDCFSFLSTGGGDPMAGWAPGYDWVDVNAGSWACGRSVDGPVGCWNTSLGGGVTDLDVPGAAVLVDPVALDNGGTPYVCALVGGQVDCWGTAPTVPAPAGNWSALTMHGDRGCVLSLSGELSCWGADAR